MVADHRSGARLEPAPHRRIALRVVRGRAVLVGVVAGGEHGPGHALEDPRRCRVAGVRAGRDVTGSDENGIDAGAVHDREAVDRDAWVTCGPEDADRDPMPAGATPRICE